MTIPTDRLRELANGATIYGHERNEIAAELLACREERESQRFILSGLRALLVRCGRAVGVKMADEVSTDFLGYVPAEVERVVARLHEDRDAARAEAESLRDQRDRLLRAVRGAGCSSTMARLADEIEESDDRPIPWKPAGGGT